MELISIKTHESILLKSRFALLWDRGIVENFGIKVEKGYISAVGNFKELKKTFSGKVLDLGDTLLMPCLVNVHIHLELSYLKGKIKQGLGFLPWVKEVIKLKNTLKPSEEDFKSAISQVFSSGVALIGDVGNNFPPVYEKILPEGIRGVYFWEYLGFKKREISESVLDSKNKLIYSLSAHAPHTVSLDMIKVLKNLTQRAKLPFSIHCAESEEELEFFKKGKNSNWGKFLLERGHEFGDLPAGLTPVKYLESLGVLDSFTILVHCLHLEEEDYYTIKKYNVSVCLCPRSNHFIQNKVPDLKGFLKAGINLCIGTDSLASNEDLDLWKELEFLSKTHSWISAEELLRMASLNGAIALGFSEFGKISVGARPELIAIDAEKLLKNKKLLLYDLLNSEKIIRYRIYGED